MKFETTSATAAPEKVSFRYPTRLSEQGGEDWQPGRKSPRPAAIGKPEAFVRQQRVHLLELRTALEESRGSASRVARLEKPESSAFSTHNGDAGSDACDRDLVLLLLSQGSSALAEIDAALERIDAGRYGICEVSGRPIPAARLRALPIARCTVEAQEEIETRQKHLSQGRTLVSPFAVAEDDANDG